MACEGRKASSLLQMSRTLMGLLVTLRGGSFGGEIRSRRFFHTELRFDCQLTLSPVGSGPVARGAALNISLRFSTNPPPYSSGVNAPLALPITLTGRSVRNSFKLERKPVDNGL